MADRRSLSAYQRRNARAQALGYRNYYDYRIHNHGRISPDRPAPKGEARQRLRGHRGPEDLLATLKPGTQVMVWGWERDPTTGRYTRVDLHVVDAKGKDRLYRLQAKHLKRGDLRKFVEALAAKGAQFTPGGSLDVRRLVAGTDAESAVADDDEPGELEPEGDEE